MKNITRLLSANYVCQKFNYVDIHVTELQIIFIFTAKYIDFKEK